jgi:hypothetical protein
MRTMRGAAASTGATLAGERVGAGPTAKTIARTIRPAHTIGRIEEPNIKSFFCR